MSKAGPLFTDTGAATGLIRGTLKDVVINGIGKGMEVTIPKEWSLCFDSPSVLDGSLIRVAEGLASKISSASSREG